MNDTVFGKIIRGEIPCTKVYEDDLFLAFLDINPVTKGHTLLIPKDHYVWIHETPDDILAKIFVKTKELIIKIRQGLRCDYVQVGVVGNEVPHFHIHLIPRMLNEHVNQTNRPITPYKNTAEMEEIASQIKQA